MQKIRAVTLTILLIGSAILGKSQDWNAIFMHETDAEYYMAEGNFNKAADSYLKALKKYPESANIMFKLGFCLLKTDDKKEEALYYLEESAKKMSDRYDEKSLKEPSSPPEVLYTLGIAYMLNMNFEKACAAFNEYKKFANSKDGEITFLIEQRIKSCEYAKNLTNKPVGVDSKNLGEIINTDEPNFNPVISGDGKTLAYTTQVSTGNKIFISKLEGEQWTKPIDITRYLGSKYLKTSFISHDGQELYLIEEDIKNSEILVSTLQKNKWTKAGKVTKPINSKYNENHICVTRDGNTVYFSSDRKGGQGGFDIYKSTLNGENWGDPINLGPNINTPLNENYPFLTPDEQYLFFSSEGHNSIGGYDIFYTDLNNTSSIKNIGYPLNTPDENMFFQPTSLTAGFYAKYSKDGLGGLDIYSVEVVPFVDLKINVMLAEDAPTDKNYNYTITEITNNKVIESKTTKGKNQVTQRVTPGKYRIQVDGSDFQTAEGSVNIPSSPTEDVYQMSIVLNGLKKEEVQQIAEVPVPQETPIPTKEIKPTPKPEPISKTDIPTATDKSKEGDEALPKPNITAKKEEQPQPKTKPVAKEKTPKSKAPTTFKHTPSASSSMPESYSVQLLAVKSPADIDFVEKLDSVNITISPEGYYRYSVGNTKTIQEAEDILGSLKAKGINKLFVRINREHPGYTIQIMALSTPKKLAYFGDIANVMVFKGRDGLYRYCIGKYSTPDDAAEDIKKLSEMGHHNAFVRTLGH